ncbi:MAG: hypothetical protein LBE13_09245 [Bacteroidales bacterium]|jgi:tetratricopeptide (TPR) repeat protein|nr:hypothetical protein [Bacteroidales bacterium]
MVLGLILGNLLAELAVISSQKHKITRPILYEFNLLNFIMSHPGNPYFASLEPNYFCSLGLMLMERGHAMLRLNDLESAKKILRKAHELFDKTMIGDHIFRVRMQEAETLIRLGYYDDAYKNCIDVLEKYVCFL